MIGNRVERFNMINNMEKAKEYYAFISYNSEDEKWAKKLQRKLERFHLPSSFNGRADVRDNLREVFRDRDVLHAGPDWEKQVKTALDNTNNLIVICSPRAAKSEAVNAEIERFIALGKEDSIYPFIIEGDNPKDYFPPALMHSKTGGDVNKDGENAAFIKIVSGMLGVDFEALWQRHKREQRKKFIMWLFLVSSFIILMLYVFAKFSQYKEQQIAMAWNLKEKKAIVVSERANVLTDNGDPYLAQLLLLNVLPTDSVNPDWPYLFETEFALRKACSSHEAVFRSNSEIESVTLSPNGCMMASTSQEGTINIWDISVGLCIGTLKEHSAKVSCISFSSNNEWLLSASYDKTIKLWNLKSGKCEKTFRGHSNMVSSAVFAPNNNKILSASLDGTVRIWDIKTGSNNKLSGNYPEGISFACYSPDGRIIAFAHDKSVLIFDALTEKCIKSLIGHTQPIRSICFSPDNTHIVSASNDSTIRIWDIRDGGCLHVLEEHVDWVNNASYSSDGKHIVSSSNDQTVKVWDAVKGGRSIRTLNDHTDIVTSASFNFDGKLIASSSYDKTIRILDPKLGHRIDGEYIQSVDLNCIDGNRFCVATKTWDNTPIIWDVKTGKRLFVLNSDNKKSSEISALTYSPNTELIAAASSDGIKIWNVSSHECISFIDTGDLYITSLAFSPNCETIASASYKTIKLWNIQQSKCIKTFEPHPKRINALSFSPDGNHIASVSGDTIIRVFNVKTKVCEHMFKGHKGFINTIEYSPDGKKIVTASDDYTIKIWDIMNDNCQTLIGHANNVNSASYSPDGRYIISSSGGKWGADDNSVRIWDVSKRDTCVQIFKDYNSNIYSAKFSSDGKSILFTTDDKFLYIERFPSLYNLIEESCNRFKKRQLTAEERRMYDIE